MLYRIKHRQKRVIELELQEFGIRRLEDAWLPEIELSRDACEMAIELVHHVYGAKQIVVDYVSYPATWWDAFKIRFFPKWLIKMFPAKHTRRTLSCVAHDLFPGLEIRDRRIQLVTFDKTTEETK